jgi:hypothetical protein
MNASCMRVAIMALALKLLKAAPAPPLARRGVKTREVGEETGILTF